MAARGRHKVFLGMAAGVGKTYRMLQEGRAEAETGRDVVIGYLEPHDRPETAAQAEGLEVVPRRYVSLTQEMDLPAVLARAPQLCLVDELAHTNPAALSHEKRHEDVARLLDGGIDVLSTVNVQHLESLNDRVTELTGVRVRETLPDGVLTRADEVVLIDLTPEALIARLRAGKVYPPPTVPDALNGFFKTENLAALREIALRQVAEGVGSRRLVATDVSPVREDRMVHGAATQAVGERLMALVTLHPRSQRVVRRAWRSARRLGAELDLLIVRDPGTAAGDQREELEALRRLASVLGAHLLIEEADDVAAAAARVARERGTTYVVIGRPPPRVGLGWLREPLHDRLLRLLPTVDVRVVADYSESSR